jgi:hypothetical protein
MRALIAAVTLLSAEFREHQISQAMEETTARGWMDEVHRVRIVDLKEVHEYEVRVWPRGPLPLVVRAVIAPDALRRDALGEVLKARHAAERERERGADHVKRFRPRARWAYLSPDGAHALLGYENPAGTPMRSAAVVQIPEDGKTWDLEVRGTLEDSRWAADSKVVLLLESTERWLKSPRGLMRLLVGHPIPLHTLYVMACHLETHRCHRVEIASDLENATAHFRTDGPAPPP